jgi:uncharacterized membrane protein YfcA
VTSPADDLLLLAAGGLAGAIGSAGGITSLISYPALLAVGIPPLVANVTQAVAFVGCLPGSALGSRPELQGQWPWFRRWAVLAAAGGAAGAALLLSTPPDAFARIVPFLLALASVALLFQPRLSTWRQGRFDRSDRYLLPGSLLAVSVYDGYFGAGSGVMVLALFLLMVHQDLPRANALKNVFLGVADLVAAVGFALFGPVRWTAALPLAVGLLGGSRVGPSVTRRVPAPWLRVVVACAGLGLAIRLWVVPISG